MRPTGTLTGVACEQGAKSFDWRPAETEILSQRIGGSQRHNAESYICSYQWLQGLVDSAIAATCEDRVVALPHGGMRESLGAAGRCVSRASASMPAFLSAASEIPHDEGPACGVLP